MRKTIVTFALCLVSCCMSTLHAQRSDELTINRLRALGVPFYEGNDVQILTTGPEKFADMFLAIENARRFIHLDYFKFQEDNICNEMFDLLQKKARQGVKVRVMFDAFCNGSSEKPLTEPFLQRMRESGIEIYPFDKVKFPWINHLLHRDHHKIAIIDGECVYSGGMNVADYYLYGKPIVGEWRDMHFKSKGEIVAAYEKTFANMWYKTTGEVLDSVAYRGMNVSNGTSLIGYVDRIPCETQRIMRQAYCAAIDNAQSMIQIVNPYACLFGMVRSSLYRALKRGVRVQFMVSTRSDGQQNADVTGFEMKKLMKRGAEVYYYEGGFHHSKYMIVDTLFCTIGTANLDGRSLNCDYEVNSFFFDPNTPRSLHQVFERDKAQKCTLLTPEEWKKRFPLKRRMRTSAIMMIKKAL